MIQRGGWKLFEWDLLRILTTHHRSYMRYTLRRAAINRACIKRGKGYTAERELRLLEESIRQAELYLAKAKGDWTKKAVAGIIALVRKARLAVPGKLPDHGRYRFASSKGGKPVVLEIEPYLDVILVKLWRGDRSLNDKPDTVLKYENE